MEEHWEKNRYQERFKIGDTSYLCAKAGTIYFKAIQPLEVATLFQVYSYPLHKELFEKPPTIVIVPQDTALAISFLEGIFGDSCRIPLRQLIPEEKFLFISDSGDDAVHIYRKDEILELDNSYKYSLQAHTELRRLVLDHSVCCESPENFLKRMSFLVMPSLPRGKGEEENEEEYLNAYSTILWWVTERTQRAYVLIDLLQSLGEQGTVAIQSLARICRRLRFVIYFTVSVSSRRFKMQWERWMYNLAKTIVPEDSNSPKRPLCFFNPFREHGHYKELFMHTVDEIFVDLYLVPYSQHLQRVLDVSSRRILALGLADALNEFVRMREKKINARFKFCQTEDRTLHDMCYQLQPILTNAFVKHGISKKHIPPAIRLWDLLIYKKDLKIVPSALKRKALAAEKDMTELIRILVQSLPPILTTPDFADPVTHLYAARIRDFTCCIPNYPQKTYEALFHEIVDQKTIPVKNPATGELEAPEISISDLAILLEEGAGLEPSMARRLAALSDLTGNWSVDAGEFCTCLHMCQLARHGLDIPTTLPVRFVPKIERHKLQNNVLKLKGEDTQIVPSTEVPTLEAITKAPEPTDCAKVKFGTETYKRIREVLEVSDTDPTPPEKKVGDKAPERKVGDKAPERKVGDTAPEKKFSDTAPERKVSDTAPERKVGDTAPERKVSDTAPDRKVSDTAPERKHRSSTLEGKEPTEIERNTLGRKGSSNEQMSQNAKLAFTNTKKQIPIYKINKGVK